MLNEIGNAGSVKYLVQALKDSDWWVRSRAADALGKIGGPKVIDAVLQLVQEKDEDIRRAAIEILNQTKDERAVDHLIQATRDNDWWVSERAIDALAEIGSKRALPRLLEMLKSGNAKALPVVVRALGKLGEAQQIDAILPLLSRPEREIRIEAIQALAKLADDRQAEQVRAGCRARSAPQDQTVARLATAALAEMDVPHRQRSGQRRPEHCTSVRPRRRAASTTEPPPRCPRQPTPSGTTVMPEAALDQARKQAEAVAAGHHDAQDRRHHRGALQVHRPHRPRRLRHRAADGGHGRRRAADSQVPESQRRRGRRGDEALRARAALLAQDHAQERHPHL